MTLQPILDASIAIQIHLLSVLPAAVIGAVMLVARKGTRLHRLSGRVWIALMAVTAISSFFIHEIRVFGDFSPIHLLSVVTLFSCVVIVWSARTGRYDLHRTTVLQLYWGAIVIAGAFTFAPGRTMHEVAFGPEGLAGLSVAAPQFVWIAIGLGAMAAAVAAVRSLAR